MAFIDAGMVTSLSERDQSNFFSFVWCVCSRDGQACTKHIKSLASNKIDPNLMESLDASLNELFDSINKLPIPDINVGTTIQRILSIAGGHGIKFEGNFALLLTQLIIMEGIARTLDPNINIIGGTIPFLLNRKIHDIL